MLNRVEDEIKFYNCGSWAQVCYGQGPLTLLTSYTKTTCFFWQCKMESTIAGLQEE